MRRGTLNLLAIIFVVVATLNNLALSLFFVADVDIFENELYSTLSQISGVSSLLFYLGIILTFVSIWRDVLGVSPFSSELRGIVRVVVISLGIMVLIYLVFGFFVFFLNLSSLFFAILLVPYIYLLYRIAKLTAISKAERQVKYSLLMVVLTPLLAIVYSIVFSILIGYNSSLLGNSLLYLVPPLIFSLALIYLNITLRRYLEVETDAMLNDELLYMEPQNKMLSGSP